MKTMMMISALFLSAGCATTPVPAGKLARSQGAVKSAEEMNAPAEPRAALHLKLAKEQLAQATDLMKDGDNEHAAMVLQRAEADGEAALALARARSAHIEAEQAVARIQELKKSMTKGGDS